MVKKIVDQSCFKSCLSVSTPILITKTHTASILNSPTSPMHHATRRQIRCSYTDPLNPMIESEIDFFPWSILNLDIVGCGPLWNWKWRRPACRPRKSLPFIAVLADEMGAPTNDRTKAEHYLGSIFGIFYFFMLEYSIFWGLTRLKSKCCLR